jgi:hypothetical protein
VLLRGVAPQALCECNGQELQPKMNQMSSFCRKWREVFVCTVVEYSTPVPFEGLETCTCARTHSGGTTEHAALAVWHMGNAQLGRANMNVVW